MAKYSQLSAQVSVQVNKQRLKDINYIYGEHFCFALFFVLSFAQGSTYAVT